MPPESIVVSPYGGAHSRDVRTKSGKILTAPADWVIVPPGDPGLTRRVKASGPTWTVQEKRRNKNFSLGVWASGPAVAKIKAELAAERADPAYAKKQASAAARREVKQAAYVEDFRGAVIAVLNFAPKWASLAERLADRVAAHATPVGSGTVARTERIPIERRADAAVIAWMRHQTTGYDDMKIARVRGKRREVRRELAERSRRLLDGYRRGFDIDALSCPLQCALTQSKPMSTPLLPPAPSPPAESLVAKADAQRPLVTKPTVTKAAATRPAARKPTVRKPSAKQALIAQAVERQLAQRRLAENQPSESRPAARKPRTHSQGA